MKIYRYPLKEHAKETFNRQLKAGIDDTDLAALAVSLRENDKLCIVFSDKIITPWDLVMKSLWDFTTITNVNNSNTFGSLG